MRFDGISNSRFFLDGVFIRVRTLPFLCVCECRQWRSGSDHIIISMAYKNGGCETRSIGMFVHANATIIESDTT